MISTQRSSARKHSQRGSAMVEAALSLTTALMFIFGIMEFGRAVFAYNQLATLAQTGARYASVRGSTTASPATASSVQTYVQGIAVGLNPLTVTTTWQKNQNVPGNWVRVQVSYPVRFVAPYVPSGSLNLSATSQVPVIR